MLVAIELEGKSHVILYDILDLLQIREEVLVGKRGSRSVLLLDFLQANNVINWFLQNSQTEMRVRKALGTDALLFEHDSRLKEFLYKHLSVREGQKWVIEQLPGERYIALRRAMAQEVKAYNRKEEIIGVEPDKIMRVVSIGKDIPLECIDFTFALQYM
ncbi:MAG: hypothetical protein A2Y62_14925 [Candidatus Fischerbacteria bacterium RBG_13_37_8]|uniref:Uncharacterized protein n=1 Tax=Candidatus Fischerbacteria bacterium RBG_13_37_8 TaxID=1817863 RepID=A0A1F5V4N1_9BACT|nr:MAG: hypothetical protein A2Y62_14925 [Candidatus Fischerbacteria bacterium RBG_13_37_8]